MTIFAINTNEYNLLKDYINETFICDKTFPLEDNYDNYLLYIIDKKMAMLAKIVNYSEDDGLYCYTTSLMHITEPNSRALFPFSIQGFSNFLIVPKNQEQKILNCIRNSEYSFHYYLTNIDDLIQQEKNNIEKDKKKINKNNTKRDKFHKNGISEQIYKNINEPHLKAQYILKELANVIEIDSFIAKNDQHRTYKNNLLSENTMQYIPEYPIPKEIKNHISLIDVLWFDNETPKACFEVEMSTSVYSGLLRMADFICSIQNPSIELYIVTTRNRENKIKKELNRPIFKQIGLSQLCKVIYLDDLENLYNLTKLLKGYIKPNILDRISYSFFEFST